MQNFPNISMGAVAPEHVHILWWPGSGWQSPEASLIEPENLNEMFVCSRVAQAMNVSCSNLETHCPV